MAGTFKPYRHAGCLIYSPKNRKFLEQFAERIHTLSVKEKSEAHGNTIKYGGVRYQLLYQDGKMYLVSDLTKSNKAKGTVYLVETR